MQQDAEQEIPRVAHELRVERAATPAGLADAFRLGSVARPPACARH
jgi:hypothetical protein